MMEADAKTNKEAQGAGESVARRWYALQVVSGREKKARELLEQMIEREGLRKEFGLILVPSEEVVEMRKSRKQRVERLLFPGYILVQMVYNQENHLRVKGITPVLGFVSDVPLTEEEIGRIVDTTDRSESDAPKMATPFQVGEEVRIISGPFADYNCIIEDLNMAKERARVSVSIFQARSIPVELDFSQIVRE